MKRLLLILSIILISILSIKAQQLRLGLQTGLNTFSFNDLKNLNSFLQTNIPFKTKVVANYPSFVYMQPSIMYIKDNYRIGMFFNYKSTGSRISSKDYSGEYTFDSRINANTFGITAEYFYYKIKFIRLGAYANIGYSLTKLNLKEHLVVWNQTIANNSSQTFNARDSYIESGLTFDVPIKNYGLALNAGYSLQTTSSNLTAGDQKLFNPKTNNYPKAQWSGFRAGITVYYVFEMKSTSKSNSAL